TRCATGGALPPRVLVRRRLPARRSRAPSGCGRKETSRWRRTGSRSDNPPATRCTAWNGPRSASRPPPPSGRRRARRGSWWCGHRPPPRRLSTGAMWRGNRHPTRRGAISAARASRRTSWRRGRASPRSACGDTPGRRDRRAIARARWRTEKESAGSRRLDYRRLVDLSVFAHDAFIDQLLEVRAQRHLGRDHQLVIQLAIHAACELGRGTTAAVHLSQDLRLAFEAVAAILLDLGRGLGHRVPVARE